MKIRISKPIEHDVFYVGLEVPVNYDEEDMPNDFPGRLGNLWKARIAISNGDLWLYDGYRFPPISRELYMKVVDSGTYSLLNPPCEEIIYRECGVPGFFPGDHYGDYLILDIKDGRIVNWKATEQSVQRWVDNE